MKETEDINEDKSFDYGSVIRNGLIQKK